MKAQDLKNSILQLAIQGKLVEQRKEEGTAKELLEQIEAEKENLIKEGKIKKTKPLPEITEDEIPFDIPESWEWVRLGEIGFTNIGLTYKPSDISNSGTIVLRSSNIQNGELDYNDLVKVNKDIPLTKMCQIGDILICARNGSKRLVGKSALIDKDGMSFGAFMAIYRSFCNEYVLHIISSAYFRNTMLPETGTTTINQITQETLRHCMIPLPPLAEQKRIVAKIQELMPYVDQYDKAYTEVEELNKKFPEDMQKSILQYAIQGKLVEQREEDGTAEELYQQIQVEKEKLIKEGKIKKTKPLPEITEDEIPFDIPENWKWVRLGDVCNYGKCNSTPAKNIPKNAWLLDLEDIEKDSGRVLNKKRMQDVKSTSSKHIFKVGDVLYSKLRPYLNKVVIADEDGYSTSEILPLNFGLNIYNKYAQNVLMSPYFIQYTVKCSYGVKMPRLGTTDGQLAVFPIPPLEEQKRIVAKIEELTPYCQNLTN